MNERSICRFCWKNASGGPRQPEDRCLGPITPNRHGQPARAAVAALVCLHGLRLGDLRALQLGDLRDGRLRIGGRVVLLAEPVGTRLRAWIGHREARRPGSQNPPLFIHFRSAARTEPAGQRWVKLTLGIPGSVQALREDRILSEARATRGDARRLHDFSGASIQAAVRYTATVGHPHLVGDQTAIRDS